jgi:hypothetical protein
MNRGVSVSSMFMSTFFLAKVYFIICPRQASLLYDCLSPGYHVHSMYLNLTVGWQGIIPTKAEKMASISFDLMTKKLFSIHEIFSRLDPKKFSETMEDAVLLMMDNVINEVATQYMPQTWANLPKEVRDDIIVSADNESGKFMLAFM